MHNKKIIRDASLASLLVLICFFTGSLINSMAQIGETAPLPTVSYDEVKQASLQGNPTLIDARNEVSFNIGHIPNAINLPVDSDNDKIKLAVATYNNIIVYCTGASCPDSKKLAAKLIAAGAENIKIYPGGWEEWVIVEGPM